MYRRCCCCIALCISRWWILGKVVVHTKKVIQVKNKERGQPLKTRRQPSEEMSQGKDGAELWRLIQTLQTRARENEREERREQRRGDREPFLSIRAEWDSQKPYSSTCNTGFRSQHTMKKAQSQIIVLVLQRVLTLLKLRRITFIVLTSCQ